jgi:putative ATP-dependent endonuclease of OLD family
MIAKIVINEDYFKNSNSYLTEKAPLNYFYGKEVFFTTGFNQDNHILYQIAGNLGAYANDYDFNSTINVFVLSNTLFDKLIMGSKDEIITQLEKILNNKGQLLNDLLVITETSFINFVKKRISTYDDRVTQSLISVLKNTPHDKKTSKMKIDKLVIENFKCFKGKFCIELNEGLNILVGDNESGKSTILEAIHLTLTGLFNGKYLKNEITQYLFNWEVVADYLKRIANREPASLPYILFEVYMSGDDLAIFEGDGNSERKRNIGISLKIAFDENYQSEYEQLIKAGNIKTIPIEYYDFYWSTFARDSITSKSIPIKSAMIDSSSNRYANGSDIYISRIIKENLDAKEIVDISQAYRKMKEVFMAEEAIKTINSKIRTSSKISDKNVSLSVELSSKNAWETSLTTYLDDIPFHFIGKGEQCLVKTKLALGHKKSKEANLILLEEPENHLSFSKLNQLISNIKDFCENKQIIISTHNSFIANKLGLENLILLHHNKTTKLKDLNPETYNFFKKLAGYNTLRLILSKKAVLCEGDSDELIIQKAFYQLNGNKLPIEKGIDVISVGTSFLRFLEVAEKIGKQVSVVTDNDGNTDKLRKKYSHYLEANAKPNIKICFDPTVDSGSLNIDGKPFNYNTLEPKLLKANGIEKTNRILGTSLTDIDELHKFMQLSKTECALKFFETTESISFPKYITDSFE